MLMFLFQTNILRWEKADPPWVLPVYVSTFSCDLTVNKAWIMNGGVAKPTTVEVTTIVPPTLPRPQAVSKGNSEVRASDENSCPKNRWSPRCHYQTQWSTSSTRAYGQ